MILYIFLIITFIIIYIWITLNNDTDEFDFFVVVDYR